MTAKHVHRSHFRVIFLSHWRCTRTLCRIRWIDAEPFLRARNAVLTVERVCEGRGGEQQDGRHLVLDRVKLFPSLSPCEMPFWTVWKFETKLKTSLRKEDVCLPIALLTSHLLPRRMLAIRAHCGSRRRPGRAKPLSDTRPFRLRR